MPSGAQAGEALVPPNLGNDTMRFKSREYIRMSQTAVVSELKAIRNASGEMRGEREIEPR